MWMYSMKTNGRRRLGKRWSMCADDGDTLFLDHHVA